VSQARSFLGSLATEADGDLGYPQRCLAHVVGGLLSLFRPDMTSEERSDVKTKLGKALRMAHQQLQNHQVVSQVLLFMAPLQVGALGGCRVVARMLLHVWRMRLRWFVAAAAVAAPWKPLRLPPLCCFRRGTHTHTRARARVRLCVPGGGS
jgi:hypothetical protein